MIQSYLLSINVKQVYLRAYVAQKPSLDLRDLRWVMTFYKNIQSCVINNGITSNYFTLERGVRQRDPLSPYLFVVAVETLAITIRQNSMINGITIEKEETKLLQYADDTTAVLSDINSAHTFLSCLTILRSFQA